MRRLKYLRLCKSMTQLDLANKVMVAQSKISILETKGIYGCSESVSEFTLGLIARKLNYAGDPKKLLEFVNQGD